MESMVRTKSIYGYGQGGLDWGADTTLDLQAERFGELGARIFG